MSKHKPIEPSGNSKGDKNSETASVELDHTLPPCSVCKAVSSGYHYGANTCEACKAFYRRSIGNEDSIKPCIEDGKCAENPTGKIRCAECRHKKCLAIGMAREGCRKGRYTSEKKIQNTKDVQLHKAQVCVSKTFQTENCEGTANMLAAEFANCFTDIYQFIKKKDTLYNRIREGMGSEKWGKPLEEMIHLPGETSNSSSELQTDMFNKISGSFRDGKVSPDGATFSKADSVNQQTLGLLFEAGATEIDQMFTCFAKFAKRVPGFSDIDMEDRIVMIKEGKIDIINIIRHKMICTELRGAVRYLDETGDIYITPLSYSSQLFRFDYGEHLYHVCRIAFRMQKLDLTTQDIAVLLAFVLMSPDREGLRQPHQIEQFQEKLLPVLQYTLMKNHPKESSILAETMLMIPILREATFDHAQAMAQLKITFKPEIAPVLAEVAYPGCGWSSPSQSLAQ